MGLLDKKNAIVTGAGNGLGRGIAEAFAKEGANVAVCARKAEILNETAEIVRSHGVQSIARTFDLQDTASFTQFMKDVAEEWGPLEIGVHNAALMPVYPIEETPEEAIDSALSVNLKAAAVMAKTLTPGMKEIGGGSLLLMSSGNAYYGIAEHSIYNATKAGLLGLSRGLAVELAPHNIRINTVSPGTIDTPLLDRYIASHAEDEDASRRAFDEMHPRGQIGSIEEVANCFVFLASDAAANINGTDLRCDGGLAIKGIQPTV